MPQVASHPATEESKGSHGESSTIQPTFDLETETNPNHKIIQVLLSTMPDSGKMVRTHLIGIVANALRDQGVFNFQRLREGGEAWNQIKSAINSAIRQGLIEGDQKYIWKARP